MPQIISASRRTDIPAFYAEWFMNRIRAGCCQVPNPRNPKQILTVSLKPEDVTAIVFWTRHALPLVPFLDELDGKGYKYYFQYTLTGYPKAFEPNAPALEDSLHLIENLSRRLGAHRVIWRYDPVILSALTPPEWHQRHLKMLMGRFSGLTQRMVISFIDPYRHMMTPMRAVLSEEEFKQVFDQERYRELAGFIAEEAGKHGLQVFTCAENLELSGLGIMSGKCIDDDLISILSGRQCKKVKDPSQRPLCGCVSAKDIGMNNSCLFGCRYCYATSSHEKSRINHAGHQTGFEMLYSAV